MIAVIGAGVVGLAIARALALRHRDVVVIERHRRAGLDASTHNSGVIHAGLYHPADSLKAQLCVEGRDRLVAFAEAHGVPHLRYLSTGSHFDTYQPRSPHTRLPPANVVGASKPPGPSRSTRDHCFGTTSSSTSLETLDWFSWARRRTVRMSSIKTVRSSP